MEDIKHRQVKPAVMVSDYRIRAVCDSENPTTLAKATWHNPNNSGSGFSYTGGPSQIETLVMDKHDLYVTTHSNGVTCRIPVGALEALLKVAGWKAEQPQETED